MTAVVLAICHCLLLVAAVLLFISGGASHRLGDDWCEYWHPSAARTFLLWWTLWWHPANLLPSSAILMCLLSDAECEIGVAGCRDEEQIWRHGHHRWVQRQPVASTVVAQLLITF